MDSAKTASARGPGAWLRLYAVFRIALLAGIFLYLGTVIYGGRDLLASLEIDWNPLALTISLLLAVLGYECLFLAWLLLLKRLQLYRSQYLFAYARIWWVSYVYRYVPGKVMLVVERARLGVAAGIDAPAGVTLAFIETSLALTAGCAVSLLSLAYYSGATYGYLLGFAGLLLVVLVAIPIGCGYVFRIPALLRRYPQLASFDLRTIDALLLTLPYVAHYLLLGCSFFLLLQCIYPLPLSALPGLCGVFALSHVVGVVVLIAPGGLGVREGALALQLHLLMPASIAGAAAIAFRIWLSIAEILCLGAAVLFDRRVPADPGSGRNRSGVGGQV